MEQYCIITNRSWGLGMVDRLKHERRDAEWKSLITDEFCVFDGSRYVFYLFWSDKVPKRLTDRGNCIGFHLCAGKYTAGGTPVQNAIAKGYTEGLIKAFIMDDGIDTGKVIGVSPVSLNGSAEEIYLRMADVMYWMIIDIINGEVKPLTCANQAVGGKRFKRRKPEDSRIKQGSLVEIYDQIRMVDAEGYPNAFIDHDGYRYEFSRASLKTDHIAADVKITEVLDGKV